MQTIAKTVTAAKVEGGTWNKLYKLLKNYRATSTQFDTSSASNSAGRCGSYQTAPKESLSLMK